MFSSASLNFLSRLLNAAALCPPSRSSLFYNCRCVYFIIDAVIMMSGGWYCIIFEDFYTAVQGSSIVLGVVNALLKLVLLGFSPKFPRIIEQADRIHSVLSKHPRTAQLAMTNDTETVERCVFFLKFMSAYFPTSILAAMYKAHFRGSDSTLLIAAFYFPKMPHYTINLTIQILVLLPVWMVLTSYVISVIALTSLIASFMKCLICMFEDQKLGRIDSQLFEIHRDIIMLVDEINRSISSFFFFEIIILSPLQSCFCAYGTIVGFNTKSIQGYYSALLLVFSFALPYALCRSFQAVINESERLHNSVYSLKWHERSPRERKNIIFLAMQTTRGLTFQYRREFVFNMERFCEYLQCVLSFVTLIKNLKAE